MTIEMVKTNSTSPSDLEVDDWLSLAGQLFRVLHITPIPGRGFDVMLHLPNWSAPFSATSLYLDETWTIEIFNQVKKSD